MEVSRSQINKASVTLHKLRGEVEDLSLCPTCIHIITTYSRLMEQLLGNLPSAALMDKPFPRLDEIQMEIDRTVRERMRDKK